MNDVERKASELASESGLDEDEVQRIEMAVREAAVNAVYHGNAYDPNKKMTFAMERTPESLIITITDEGKGLDESEIPGSARAREPAETAWPGHLPDPVFHGRSSYS